MTPPQVRCVCLRESRTRTNTLTHSSPSHHTRSSPRSFDASGKLAQGSSTLARSSDMVGGENRERLRTCFAQFEARAIEKGPTAAPYIFRTRAESCGGEVERNGKHRSSRAEPRAGNAMAAARGSRPGSPSRHRLPPSTTFLLAFPVRSLSRVNFTQEPNPTHFAPFPSLRISIYSLSLSLSPHPTNTTT